MAKDIRSLSLTPLSPGHQWWGGAPLGFVFTSFHLHSLIFYSLISCAASVGSLPGKEHDYGISPKFVCTPIPPEADPSCYSPPSVPHGPSSDGHGNGHANGHGNGHANGYSGSSWRGVLSDEAKATILHLRESLVRQKETILDQRETIRELTAKLTLCEGFGGHRSVGRHDNHHSNHHDNHHDSHYNNHGDDHHGHRSSSSSHHGPHHGSDHHNPHDGHRSDPRHRQGVSYGTRGAFSPEQTGKTLQTLKERLENLEARNSSSSYSSSLRDLLQRKINALEVQLHDYYRDRHDYGQHSDHHGDHHDGLNGSNHNSDHHDDHHGNGYHDDHHSNGHHEDHQGNGYHDNHHDDHNSNGHHDDHHDNHHGNGYRDNHHDDHHSNGRHDDHRDDHYYHRNNHHTSYDRHYDHHYDRSHRGWSHNYRGNHHSSHHNDHHDSYRDDRHGPGHRDDYRGNNRHDDRHDIHHGHSYHDDHHDDHHDDRRGDHHDDRHGNDHHDVHHDSHDHHPVRSPPGLKETTVRGAGHNKLEMVLSQLHLSNHGNHKKIPGTFQLDFPMRTNYMYARMKRSVVSEIFALTFCLWLKAGAGPGVGAPFSYAVPGQANELVLLEWGGNPMQLLINDKAATMPVTLTDGKWHHVCVTWTTRDGLWEAYQDGVKKGSGQNLSAWHAIKPGGIFIMGQEQDTMGGRFDVSQSFMGDMADLQLWSRVLTPNEILGQATCGGHLAGDVMSWSEEAVELHGGLTKYPFDPCH